MTVRSAPQASTVRPRGRWPWSHQGFRLGYSSREVPAPRPSSRPLRPRVLSQCISSTYILPLSAEHCNGNFAWIIKFLYGKETLNVGRVRRGNQLGQEFYEKAWDVFRHYVCDCEHEERHDGQEFVVTASRPGGVGGVSLLVVVCCRATSADTAVLPHHREHGYQRQPQPQPPHIEPRIAPQVCRRAATAAEVVADSDAAQRLARSRPETGIYRGLRQKLEYPFQRVYKGFVFRRGQGQEDARSYAHSGPAPPHEKPQWSAEKTRDAKVDCPGRPTAPGEISWILDRRDRDKFARSVTVGPGNGKLVAAVGAFAGLADGRLRHFNFAAALRTQYDEVALRRWSGLAGGRRFRRMALGRGVGRRLRIICPGRLGFPAFPEEMPCAFSETAYGNFVLGENGLRDVGQIREAQGRLLELVDLGPFCPRMSSICRRPARQGRRRSMPRVSHLRRSSARQTRKTAVSYR